VLDGPQQGADTGEKAGDEDDEDGAGGGGALPLYFLEDGEIEAEDAGDPTQEYLVPGR
jgi:hypothetical protein